MAPRRRTLLAAVSTAAASTAAGCADLLAGDTDEETSDPVDDIATALVEDLANGRFEEAGERFASNEQARRGDPGRLERLWMAYTSVGGDFEEIGGTDVRTENGYELVDVTLSFDGGDHGCGVVVDGDSNVVDCGVTDEYQRPSYVDSDAITDADVTLSVPDCSLPGVVTTPAGDDGDGGGVPGVVLVHDSGPVTKDSPNGGTKAFADLAEGLATRGVATLRYDKRIPTCDVAPGEYTLDRVTVDDALVAVDRLRGVDGVDSNRIVVVGHGLGGRAAPRITARDGDLAGVVGLAAPARPYHDLTLEQLEHKVSIGDHEWDDLANVHEAWADQIERVREGEYEADEQLLGKPGAFWDSLAAYDHLEAAAGLETPSYFLQGERDFQVSVGDDLELWEAELTGDASVETYEGLDHLFMPGEGESVEFAYALRNNVAERVVDDLTAWIGEL